MATSLSFPFTVIEVVRLGASVPGFGGLETRAGQIVDEALRAVDMDGFGAQRRSVLWLSRGSARLCLVDGEVALAGWRELAEAARGTSSAMAGEKSGGYWVRYRPRLRIYVVGRDPAMLATGRLSAEIGYETILVRENGPPAPPPFAVEHYWRGPPAEAFRELGVDERTAIVVGNHDLDADHGALLSALKSDAPFVGVVGAQRYRKARLDRLASAGVTEDQLLRLEAPVGLFRARTPWDFALSVLAQIAQRFSEG